MNATRLVPYLAIVVAVALASCSELKIFDQRSDELEAARNASADAQARVTILEQQVQAGLATQAELDAAVKAMIESQARAKLAADALEAARDEAKAAIDRTRDTASGVSAFVPPPYGTVGTGVIGLIALLFQGKLARGRDEKNQNRYDTLEYASDAVVKSINALIAAGKLDPHDPVIKGILDGVQGAEGRTLVKYMKGEAVNPA